MGNVEVSILCLAFNHEQYIRDAIEGFLMQKTTFEYEIIINEDASTDGTAKIIREYEDKYPDIIHPIYHKVNQYSKGININDKFMVPLAKGKYVALCDGDDYWTDPYKLQKQYDAMEANPSCHMCLHKVRELNLNDTSLMMTIPRNDVKDGVLSSYEFFTELGQSNFFNEVCYFFRKDEYEEYQRNYPNFAKAAMKNKTDDTPMLLYFGSLGDVYYIDEELAVYRHFVGGSWSDKFSKASSEKVKNWCDNACELYTLFNQFTDNKYREPLKRKLLYLEYKKAEIEHDYKRLVSEELRPIFKSQSKSTQKRICLLAKNPALFGLLFNFYDTVRGNR